MQPGPVWAVITGQAASTNRYSWTQLDEGDTAAFDAGLADDFAAQGTSDEAGYPAYELNGRTDVPIDGTIKCRLYPAGDLSYVVFVAPGGGSGTSTSCTGCGWVAALTDVVCLSVTVGDTPSDLTLTSDDGASWGSLDTITICGLDYTVGFSKGACDGPCLTLTHDGGTAGTTTYTGTRDCCGCGYAVFAFPTSVLCPDDDLGGLSPCDQLTKVRVDWACCPIDDWDDEGWYCTRPAGSGDPCAPEELLDADRCDHTIEICSGPYADEAAAEAACGPGPAGCPDSAKDILFTVTGTTGDCDCADGTSVTLTYSGSAGTTNFWQGGGPGVYEPCSYPIQLSISCDSLTGAVVFTSTGATPESFHTSTVTPFAGVAVIDLTTVPPSLNCTGTITFAVSQP